jgi:hypothetical protein
LVYSGAVDAAATRLALVTRDDRSFTHELHVFVLKGLANRAQEALQRAEATARAELDRAASCVPLRRGGPMQHPPTPAPLHCDRYERYVRRAMQDQGDDAPTGRVLGTFSVHLLDDTITASRQVRGCQDPHCCCCRC